MIGYRVFHESRHFVVDIFRIKTNGPEVYFSWTLRYTRRLYYNMLFIQNLIGIYDRWEIRDLMSKICELILSFMLVSIKWWVTRRNVFIDFIPCANDSVTRLKKYLYLNISNPCNVIWLFHINILFKMFIAKRLYYIIVF